MGDEWDGEEEQGRGCESAARWRKAVREVMKTLEVETYVRSPTDSLSKSRNDKRQQEVVGKTYLPDWIFFISMRYTLFLDGKIKSLT